MRRIAGILVLIVNWNGREDLRACLASLAAQTERDFAVLVVDNGSADGSAEMVRREFPGVRLLQTGANLGFAEGCNRGLAEAREPWVLLLNNDTRADAGALAALRGAARAAGPRLGMLQARLLFLDRPQLVNSSGVLVYSDGTFVDREFAAPVRPAQRPEPIFCACAGAALYRRAMLEELRLPTGVLDRSFFMYYEDVDLGWRARLAGWEAMCVPQALVYHRFQGSSDRQRRAFVAAHCHANKVRTLLKNASLRYLGGALLPVLFRDVLPLFRHRGTAAPRLLLAALRDGLAQRHLLRCRLPRREIERQWVLPWWHRGRNQAR